MYLLSVSAPDLVISPVDSLFITVSASLRRRGLSTGAGEKDSTPEVDRWGKTGYAEGSELLVVARMGN